ncbi:hypothetical protein GWK26_12730 [haloarchaeon 3A1-DGR]|nr:hypothetical protein GWK26_12730 [haloarchaeon 3A1-DGR]
MGLLKPIYQRLRFFPYLGSLRLQTWRRKSNNDQSRVDKLRTLLSDRQHALIQAHLLLAATLVIAFAVDSSPLTEPLWIDIETVWQVHATIIGLSFVVLVFLLEIVSRSRYVEDVLQQFLQRSRVLPVLFYSLLGSIAIGILVLYPDPIRDWVSPNVPATIFVVTILGIMFVYGKVVKLALAGPADEDVYTELKKHISKKIKEDVAVYEYDQELQDSLPDGVETQKPLYPFYGKRKDSVTADDLDLSGSVTDIYVPTFVYALSELIRIGEQNRNPNGGEEDSDFKSVAEGIEVQVKIGDNLQEFSSILQISSDVFDPTMEDVYPTLAASILTHPGEGRDDTVRQIHKYTDFMDSEGKRIVRNSQTRSFLQFLEQYQEIVYHTLHDLDEMRFLIEENRYLNADLPFYNLDQVLFRVFEEALEDVNREFTHHIVALVYSITGRAAEIDLHGAYQRYMELYARFYFAMRQSHLPDNFVTEINDAIIEDLGSSARAGMQADFENFDELDGGFRIEIESYSEVALRQAHRMFKYAFENQDGRAFIKIWTEVDIPQAGKNDAVGEPVRYEKQDMLFNAAAMTYDIAKDEERYQDTFKKIYSQCIVKAYGDLADLFEIYFRIKAKGGMRTRWGKWDRQEHDIIQQVRGRSYSIEPEFSLAEFYCFTGIMTGHHSDICEENPLKGKSISEDDLRRIQATVNSLKSRKPFVDLPQYLDEDDFENRAEEFVEYHKDILEDS